MKTAEIFFNGQVVCTIKFEKIEKDYSQGVNALTIGYGDPKKIVALIPNNHLIIIKE